MIEIRDLSVHKRLLKSSNSPNMMLSSKHQVVILIVVAFLTIHNSIQDSFKNTKAIRREKEINILRVGKLDRGDSKVSKEMSTTPLKMPKLPRKVVLRKPKVKMTVPMKRMCGRKGQRNPWFQRIVEKSHVGKDGKVPNDIISIPMNVMSRGIMTIVTVFKQLVTDDRKSKNVPCGPLCMQHCLRKGDLHPAQCHQLC